MFILTLSLHLFIFTGELDTKLPPTEYIAEDDIDVQISILEKRIFNLNEKIITEENKSSEYYKKLQKYPNDIAVKKAIGIQKSKVDTLKEEKAKLERKLLFLLEQRLNELRSNSIS